MAIKMIKHSNQIKFVTKFLKTNLFSYYFSNEITISLFCSDWCCGFGSNIIGLKRGGL